MSTKKINLISSETYVTRSLAIAPELVGLSHKFKINGSQVTIQLPTSDNLPEEITEESIRNSRNSILSITGYEEEDGHLIPIVIVVKSVDIFVSQNEYISLPEEVLMRNPNPNDLISEKKRKRLDSIAESHRSISRIAFDRWIRTLRWTTGNNSIGRPVIFRLKPGTGTSLLDDATNHRFWYNHPPVSLSLPHPVSLEEWEKAGESLQMGHDSPPYIDSMFDGIYQYNLGNLKLSVVNLAVACEIFMRTRVVQNLPGNLSEEILRYIDEANIRRVQEHLFKDILNEDQKRLLKSINSSLHKLFDARNTILHSGRKEDLSSLNCEEYIRYTKTLLSIGID
jgi:hypothetical protein